MANRPAAPLRLRDGDLPRLTAMARSSTVSAGLAQRARILLLAAEGLPNTAIADKVGVSRPTVLLWRARYAEAGLDDLADQPRAGRPPQLPAEEILRASLVPPSRRLGATHWSTRLLAGELGIGRGSVARAWRHYGLQPVRGGFRFATVPVLHGHVAAVLAVRLAERDSFAVLDVREPTRAGRRDGDLLAEAAGVDLASALRRAAPSVPDDPSGALLDFLEEVIRSRRRWPTGARLHLVTDGGGPLGLPAFREALAARSRISVHTASDRARWPRMVAGWLAITGAAGGAAWTELDRVRRQLRPGEVFGWTHAPGRTPVLRTRPATVR